MSGSEHDDCGLGDGPPEERPALSHLPARPERAGTVGEIAFLSAWQALMAATEGAILDRETRDGLTLADQRGATVAASLVQWFGTNAGASLVHEARRLAGTGMSPPDAFHAAWAIHNVRAGHVNHGLRSIEWILLPPGCAQGPHDPQPRDLPELTVAELDMAEHVVRWLGSTAGLAFVEAREAEIDACREMRHSRHREANRQGSAAREMSPREVADFLALIRAAEARGAAA